MFLRDPGAWASAALRENPVIKVRQQDAVLKGEFELAQVREISNWLANLVLKKAARAPQAHAHAVVLHDEGRRNGQGCRLQVCADLVLKLNEGEVKAVSLQSQESETGIPLEPVFELLHAMARRSNEIVQLRKKAY